MPITECVIDKHVIDAWTVAVAKHRRRYRYWWPAGPVATIAFFVWVFRHDALSASVFGIAMAAVAVPGMDSLVCPHCGVNPAGPGKFASPSAEYCAMCLYWLTMPAWV
jgi:hypothetical protein